MPSPYYADEHVQLWHGDCRVLVSELGLKADLILADPPYGETSLAWDRWPDDWPTAISDAAKSMWCFGSMRMFLDRRDQFMFWHLSQDVVWRKPDAAAPVVDRFRRNHETVTHWYRGPWADVHHETPLYEYHGRRHGTVRVRDPGVIFGGERGPREWVDDGTRRMLTVVDVPNMRYRGTHPTEKPVGILDPLIRYACPPGGTVIDPFAGSGSTAEAARLTGRKAILIEADERYCEAIARRMSQGILPIDEPA